MGHGMPRAMGRDDSRAMVPQVPSRGNPRAGAACGVAPERGVARASAGRLKTAGGRKPGEARGAPRASKGQEAMRGGGRGPTTAIRTPHKRLAPAAPLTPAAKAATLPCLQGWARSVRRPRRDLADAFGSSAGARLLRCSRSTVGRHLMTPKQAPALQRFLGGPGVAVLAALVGISQAAFAGQSAAGAAAVLAAAGAARPVLRHVPQQRVRGRHRRAAVAARVAAARSGAVARRRRHRQRRRRSRALGGGGAQAPRRRDAATAAPAPRQGRLRRVPAVAGGRAGSGGGGAAEPGPHPGVPPAEPDRVPQRHPRPPRSGRGRRRSGFPPTRRTASASTTTPAPCRSRRPSSSVTCRPPADQPARHRRAAGRRDVHLHLRGSAEPDSGEPAERGSAVRLARRRRGAAPFPRRRRVPHQAAAAHQLRGLRARHRSAPRRRDPPRRPAHPAVHVRRRRAGHARADQLRRQHPRRRRVGVVLAARRRRPRASHQGRRRAASHRGVLPPGDLGRRRRAAAAAVRVRPRRERQCRTATRPSTTFRSTAPSRWTAPGDTPTRRRLFTSTPASEAEGAAVRGRDRRHPRAPRPTGARCPTTTSTRCSTSSTSAGRAAASTPASASPSKRVLADPEFLYRIEHDPVDSPPNASYAIPDSTSPRGCRSSSGAAFPTTSCWPRPRTARSATPRPSRGR